MAAELASRATGDEEVDYCEARGLLIKDLPRYLDGQRYAGRVSLGSQQVVRDVRSVPIALREQDREWRIHAKARFDRETVSFAQ